MGPSLGGWFTLFAAMMARRRRKCS
ncbi:MAG TPA: hypothetical protein DCS88_07350 [Alphaproteobacteria bacterium]|nr:hypothetical protein [Alphaproteobacteria bacterium]